MKDGKAEVTWSHDGEDISGGYASEAWGLDQLKQMVKDSQDEKRKGAFLERAEEINEAHIITVEEQELTDEEIDAAHRQRDADKAAAMNARKIPEEEMIATGREFIISNWNLDAEQTGRLELYTNTVMDSDDGSDWYEMVNGKPCFKVEYLLAQPMTVEQTENGEPLAYREGDGYYNVFVNVETGEIEEYQYYSGLGGQG